jgi:hypothetical protein
MTASVASSPIFFRIASSPFANSAATYDVAGSAPRRAAIVAASAPGENQRHPGAVSHARRCRADHDHRSTSLALI